MRENKFGRNILRVLAVLLAATAAEGAARALPVGLDALPPDIATLYDAGQYRQAAEALQAAAERNPKDASLQYWLGRCFFELRDFSSAIASLERAVSLDPGRSEYHDWLGRACGRKADENSHSNMAGALSLARRTHSELFLWGEAGAHAARRDPELQRFYRRKLVQKGLGKASVAVARKLAIRLWIMLQDEIDYHEFCRRGQKQQKSGEACAGMPETRYGANRHRPVD